MTSHVRNRQGFSLIELMIVLVIIGMLAALVGPKFFGQEKKAKVKVATGQIALFETALDTFRLDMGRFPTTQEGLRALLESPANEEKWDGPYLRKDIPLDPWGNPYHYESPSGKREFEIVSYGEDGQPGGEDKAKDITNWGTTEQ